MRISKQATGEVVRHGVSQRVVGSTQTGLAFGPLDYMPQDIPKAQIELTELVRAIFSVGTARGVVGLGVQVWGSKYQIEESDGELELQLIGKSLRPEAILRERALEEDPSYLAALEILPEQRRAIAEFRRDFPEIKKAFAIKAKRLT